MCEKLKYRNPRIDKCLKFTIELINAMGVYRTLASCCGHGEYPETIVVIEKSELVKEYHTQVFLSNGKRKGNRYYEKDDRGFCYIPELGSMNQTVREIF